MAKSKKKQSDAVSDRILAAVREGANIYMPGNDEHAAALVALLSPRSCQRLLDAGVVVGDGFESKAKGKNWSPQSVVAEVKEEEVVAETADE